MKQGAIVLFSGGIDSTTALYWARERFAPLRALIVDYGQRHRIEVDMAKRIAASLAIAYDVAALPLRGLLDSALLDDGRPIAATLAASRSETSPPSTYVPFRNGIFLAIAAAYGESHDCRRLVTGFNSVDSPDYPDTTVAFARKMAAAINEGTSPRRAGRRRQGQAGALFRVVTPLARLNKREIITLGLELGADYSHSLSCYRGSEVPCLRCPSCDIRVRAFAELGMTDPLWQRLRQEGKA